ncbi:MAG: efflux RND transporter permease subunit [Nocardioides sp.]
MSDPTGPRGLGDADAAGSIPGHEIEHPMAIGILGGLITSTLLNLFVVPSLYLQFARPRGGAHKTVTA